MTTGEAERLGKRGGNTAENNYNERRKDSKDKGVRGRMDTHDTILK